MIILSASVQAQHVYERGTFLGVPSGKHINHSFYGKRNVFFATEDGVLVYDHDRQVWLEPITASEGLNQYPALLVWEDNGTQDIWIVTPDFVFVYDELSDWMERFALPREPEYSGQYSLGIADNKVVITSKREGIPQTYSAVFNRGAVTFDSWGEDSTLNVAWDRYTPVQTIAPEYQSFQQKLPLQIIQGGSIDAEGALHLDGYPIRSGTTVSTITGVSESGELFLGTHGMGVLHRGIRGGDLVPLPYGLLSPDVMSMATAEEKLFIGGRAGLTTMQDFSVWYDEAIRDPVYDFSFVSAIDLRKNDVFIAGRGGVFTKRIDKASWERVVTKKDLGSDRIYSIAAGDAGQLMIGTENGAYLYHDSGLILETVFQGQINWPVFDIVYENGTYFIATYFGLYLFDVHANQLMTRISSDASVTSPQGSSLPDPIYECTVKDSILWATTHRGILSFDLHTDTGESFLSPMAPFKPRGLDIIGKKVWIGTDNGLYSFERKTEAWRQYTTNDGLISNFVTDLVALEDYIWLGTNLGLTRINWRNL
ncbi:MAG: hypothetical protein K9N35_09435 [Candidatus Marinimicrobia bacterium]|nr:hypothetical protein [Candidatus Neomarinimicrobiota bacterium]